MVRHVGHLRRGVSWVHASVLFEFCREKFCINFLLPYACRSPICLLFDFSTLTKFGERQNTNCCLYSQISLFKRTPGYTQSNIFMVFWSSRVWYFKYIRTDSFFHLKSYSPHNNTSQGKGKAIHVETYYKPNGFQKSEAPTFLDNRHMKVVRL
jgi:hypothetical protein